MFLSLVGLLSVCAKFQLPSLSRSGLKVPGGAVGVGWWGGVVEAHFSVQLKRKTAEQNSAQRTAHNKVCYGVCASRGFIIIFRSSFFAVTVKGRSHH